MKGNEINRKNNLEAVETMQGEGKKGKYTQVSEKKNTVSVKL